MEEESKIKGTSAFDTATWLSKLIFGWAARLLLIGVKRELTIEDFSIVPSAENAQHVANNLRLNWEKELKLSKNGKSPSFIRAMVKSFKNESLLLLLLHASAEAVSIVQPMLLGIVIRHFTANDSLKRKSLLPLDVNTAAIIMCLLPCINRLLRHQFFFNGQRLAIRVKTACSILIYEKVTKLQRNTEQTSIGQILNVLANDLNHFNELGWILWHMLVAPLEVIAVYVIMWSYVGYSCFTSLILVITFLLTQTFLGRFVSKFRLAAAKMTDKRVKLMSEIITAMKVIKMYAWEKAFSKRIADIRCDEVRQIKNSLFMRLITLTSVEMVSKLLVFVTLISILFFGFKLSAEVTFVIVSLFNAVKQPIAQHVPMGILHVSESLITCQRVKRILLLEERHIYTESRKSQKTGEIRLSKFCSSWSKESKLLSLKDITCHVEPGELIIIVGPVGSGKTCLLMAMLSELEIVSGSCSVAGKLSYTPQEAWCFSASVKQNVLFSREMIREKYDTVLDICCLNRDIEMFGFGDETLIGEKGITLSGGQKARISLARAVYDDADVYIFDDPLSAVDSEVANHIFNKCINGHLKNKTRVLVTHNLQFLHRADKVLIMNQGSCLAFGTPQQLTESGIDLKSAIGDPSKDNNLNDIELVSDEKETRRKETEAKELPKPEKHKRQERKQESKTTGSLRFAVHFEFFKAGANIFMALLAIAAAVASQTTFQFIDYWLALWMDTTEAKVPSSLNQTLENEHRESFIVWSDQRMNIAFYASLIVILLIGYSLRFWSTIYICLKAAVNLHRTIFNKLLRSPISFFENNPKGRILNRFTGDIGQLDLRIPLSVIQINSSMGTVIGTVSMTCFVKPYLIIVCLILLAISLPLRRFYIRAVRNVKRYEAITRTPVYNCVSTTFDGLTCIRALRLENKCEDQFKIYLNDNNSCRFLLSGLSRSFGFMLDWCTIAFFIVITVLIFVGNDSVTGGEVGLLLSSALVLIHAFQMWLRQMSEYETNMVAAERVLEYTRLPLEAPLIVESSKPPETWPSRGTIDLSHVYLSYSKSKPILNDICFDVRSGSKIGIVGRTGAGKSSIVNALFRLVEFDGSIIIDGIDIKELGLNDLRKNISIIPQDPVMFQGTLRSNIDPNDEFTDEAIWKTLQLVKLDSIFKSIPGQLSSHLAENGSNLSVGQRQLVCMVRAMLRKNKILVMDEATANIDHETDSLIQGAIKECLKSCTVLTIAHRLNTVIEMDKILVIDGGRILEFDVPYLLLNKSDSQFKRMVEQLGDGPAALLFEMAKQRFEDLQYNDMK